MSTPRLVNSSLKINFDEHKWVIQISKNLDHEDTEEEENQVLVSIFNIPKALLNSNPESYLPQEVPIGPYHYFTPDLYEMEKYKIAAAKRVQKEFQIKNLTFQDFIQQLKRHEPTIRAHYHKYLSMAGDTLAWIMAMDASFLLEFLQIYANHGGKELLRVSSRMSHLLDSAGTNSAHNAILRDMVMLENQIPLFILRKLLEYQYSTLQEADDLLLSMLMGLCKQLSPLKINVNSTNIQVHKCAHLLDFIYHMIVPKLQGQSEVVIDEEGKTKEAEGISFGESSHVKKLLKFIWNSITQSNYGPVRIIKSILFSKPLKVIVKLPWTIITNIPGLKLIKQPIENLFSPHDKGGEGANENSKINNKIDKTPLAEEIVIPSVTELSKAGVYFAPTDEGILSISFDIKTRTLYLPSVSLDVNTEVVLRNLVAYEACNASGPLVFTRYTELMNGIIDNEEDAKFLREKGIIVNRLKSDNEVANLWNGMSKSIKLTKVEFLDTTIAHVNKYYNLRWKVKAKNYMKKYVYGSWQCLTVLAALLVLLYMALQSICSVYSCPRLFNQVATVEQ